MDFIFYDNTVIPEANGFINMGNTCYFNSLMQCILSCSSIYQVLKNKNDILSKMITNLFETQSNETLRLIWNYIISRSKNRKDIIKLDHSSQHDMNEGLMLLLESLDNIPEFNRLFEHRYQIDIFCPKCKFVSTNYQHNKIFEVQSDLKMAQVDEFKNIDKYFNKILHINDFLKIQNSYIEDYVCTKCKDSNIKFKSTRLKMIPEILPIVIKKYYSKEITPFPEYLYFIGSDAKSKIVYRLVAQSEHSGSQSGGHYWARALRKNNKWYNLNDSSVSHSNPESTINTYMLFYHVMNVQ